MVTNTVRKKGVPRSSNMLRCKTLATMYNLNEAPIVLERIKNSSKRPIAFKSSNDELLDLIEKRSSIYSKARYKINCNNLTKIEIVEKVIKNL